MGAIERPSKLLSLSSNLIHVGYKVGLDQLESGADLAFRKSTAGYNSTAALMTKEAHSISFTLPIYTEGVLQADSGTVLRSGGGNTSRWQRECGDSGLDRGDHPVCGREKAERGLTRMPARERLGLVMAAHLRLLPHYQYLSLCMGGKMRTHYQFDGSQQG
jgi:hypothetical protein